MGIKNFVLSFLYVIETTLKNPEVIFKESATKLESIIYFIILSLIFSIMSVLILPFSFSLILQNISLGYLSSTVLLRSTFSVFLFLTLLYFFLYILESIIFYVSFRFSGIRSLSDIMFVISISLTPALLFGWIPLVGFIGVVWSYILFLFGLKEKCGLRINGIVKGIIISFLLNIVILAVSLWGVYKIIFASMYSYGHYSESVSGLYAYNNNLDVSSQDNPLENLKVGAYCNDSYLNVYIYNFWGPDLSNIQVNLYDENNNLISKKAIDSLPEDRIVTLEFPVNNPNGKHFNVVLNTEKYTTSKSIECYA